MEVPVALQAPAAANGAAATARAAVDQERIHRQQQFFSAKRRAMKAPPENRTDYRQPVFKKQEPSKTSRVGLE